MATRYARDLRLPPQHLYGDKIALPAFHRVRPVNVARRTCAATTRFPRTHPQLFSSFYAFNPDEFCFIASQLFLALHAGENQTVDRSWQAIRSPRSPKIRLTTPSVFADDFFRNGGRMLRTIARKCNQQRRRHDYPAGDGKSTLHVIRVHRCHRAVLEHHHRLQNHQLNVADAAPWRVSSIMQARGINNRSPDARPCRKVLCGDEVVAEAYGDLLPSSLFNSGRRHSNKSTVDAISFPVFQPGGLSSHLVTGDEITRICRDASPRTDVVVGEKIFLQRFAGTISSRQHQLRDYFSTV